MATTDKITGPQLHIQTHKKLKRKKKKVIAGKNLYMEAWKISASVLSVRTLMQYFLSLMCLINPAPFFFSPQGVSFESFSSISSTRLYSNAITQGIKGTSIICIAYLFPFKALKDCNLKQKNNLILPSFYLWRNILWVSIIGMKTFSGSWVKRPPIYISHWQLCFLSTDYWMDGATLNEVNHQPVCCPIEFYSS